MSLSISPNDLLWSEWSYESSRDTPSPQQCSISLIVILHWNNCDWFTLMHRAFFCSSEIRNMGWEAKDAAHSLVTITDCCDSLVMTQLLTILTHNHASAETLHKNKQLWGKCLSLDLRCLTGLLTCMWLRWIVEPITSLAPEGKTFLLIINWKQVQPFEVLGKKKSRDWCHYDLENSSPTLDLLESYLFLCIVSVSVWCPMI